MTAAIRINQLLLFVLIIHQQVILRTQAGTQWVEFGEMIEGTINQSSLEIFKYRVQMSSIVRIQLSSIDSTQTEPLLAVFREDRAIISSQLPIIFDKYYKYTSIARTLCPFAHAAANLSVSSESPSVLSVELSSIGNITYSLNASLIEDQFDIELNSIRSITASPSKPQYYRVHIPAHLDSVIVKVESDDSICMTVSVQPIECPVFDLENNVISTGSHQTMTKRASITVQKSNLEDFYVVFVVKPIDFVCSNRYSDVHPPALNDDDTSRQKTFHLQISALPIDSAYWLPIAVSIALVAVIYLLSAIVVSAVSRYEQRRFELECRNAFEADGGYEEINTTSSRGVCYGSVMQDNDNYNATIPSTSSQSTSDNNNRNANGTQSERDEYSEYDRLDDARSDKYVVRAKLHLTVADMSMKTWKQRESKYRKYNWNLVTISLFYGLPVVQLVLTWQSTVRISGDLDLCWYNFGCAPSLFGLFAFNSIFSNIGYVLLGVLFLVMVKEREIRYRRMVATYSSAQIDNNGTDDVSSRLLDESQFGIPMHNGLMYAIGIAIVMEGVLSASYHVCPSASNYQFDTSFMYVIGALGLLRIYQLRHPDVNANAHVSFAVMAMFILLAMCGVYLNDVPFFWSIFALCYVIVMLCVSVEFYFKGQWRLSLDMWRSARYAIRASHCCSCIIPAFKGRFLFLLIANSINLAFVVVGVVQRPRDFPSFLLVPFIANLFLYLMYYIFMKFVNHEHLRLRALLYLISAFICWAIAMWFFVHNVSDWSETPAMSREHNRPCVLFDFYDNHDIWHFMSALSLFTSFSILICIDDDVQWTKRDKIAVF